MGATVDRMQVSIQSDHASHRHALAPILLGLLAPMIVFLIIDPRAATNMNVIAHVYMFAIFIIAAGAYLVSVFENGEITAVTVDKQAKVLVIEKTGLLAKSELEIPFSDVATVRVETRYDDDGYKSMVPVIVLSTRELIEMPDGTTEGDVAAMRRLLNLS